MVTLAGTPRLVSALQWYALLGPPLSWAVQLVLGYYTTEAACGAAGRRLGVDVHTWNAVLTVAVLAVAFGGWASAAALHAATGRGEVEDPLGRIRFLSTAGLAIGIIFLTLIVFTGAGVLALPECRR
jgi:hypothetical protein